MEYRWDYNRGANHVKCDKCEEWQKAILKCEEVKQWKNSPEMQRMETEDSKKQTKWLLSAKSAF